MYTKQKHMRAYSVLLNVGHQGSLASLHGIHTVEAIERLKAASSVKGRDYVTEKRNVALAAFKR